MSVLSLMWIQEPINYRRRSLICTVMARSVFLENSLSSSLQPIRTSALSDRCFVNVFDFLNRNNLRFFTKVFDKDSLLKILSKESSLKIGGQRGALKFHKLKARVGDHNEWHIFCDREWVKRRGI